MSQLLDHFLRAAAQQYRKADTVQSTFIVDETSVFVTEGTEEGFVLLYSPLPQVPSEMVDGINALVLRDQYRFRETDGGTIAMGPAGVFAFQMCVCSCEIPVFLTKLKKFADTAAEWSDRLSELIGNN